MNLANDFETYKEEIELIQSQNPVECELYSIISSLIRGRENSKKISIRDVSSRRGTEISNKFKSNSGFPDFVILERKKEANAVIFGAIEVKRVILSLDNDEDQVLGHVEKFNNVIYTNGIKWRFYKSDKSYSEIIIGKIKNGDIIWDSKDEWNKLIFALEKYIFKLIK